MIVWTDKKFELLKDALEAAERLDLDCFAVRFSFTERAEFLTTEARACVDELEPIFSQPAKVFPPNNEGREP